MLSISFQTAFALLAWDLFDGQSALVQVMTCCHQATSHYLHQCWHCFSGPWDITSQPERFKCPGTKTYHSIPSPSNTPTPHHTSDNVANTQYYKWSINQSPPLICHICTTTSHNTSYTHDIMLYPGISLPMRPANERCGYIVTTSLIGWEHISTDPCIPLIIIPSSQLLSTPNLPGPSLVRSNIAPSKYCPPPI